MSLFGRRAVVIVDNLRVEGLDIKFSVELDQKSFGKAEVTIFNLNSEHRQKLETSKTVDVELLVGYQGKALDRIFAGTLREVYSTKDPPDWVTTIKTGDGDKSKGGRLNRAYRKGTPLSTIWKDLTDSLKTAGVGVGNAVEAFQRGEFANGIKEILSGGVVQGDAMKSIRKMAAAANLDVGIQDGQLLVTPIGQAVEASAIVLSPRSGLVGSPEKGDKGLTKVRSLIVPGLRPKRKVRLKSELTKGLFSVVRCKYTGDTAGNDWYCECLLKEIG